MEKYWRQQNGGDVALLSALILISDFLLPLPLEVHTVWLLVIPIMLATATLSAEASWRLTCALVGFGITDLVVLDLGWIKRPTFSLPDVLVLSAPPILLAVLIFATSWAVKASIHNHAASLQGRIIRDTLTGLSNRGYFNQRLGQLLSPGNRRSDRVSLLIIDIDNFKLYNDTYGHPEGDRLLIEIANLLSGPRVFRSDDTVARIGGDEFAVLLPETLDAEAQDVAKRLSIYMKSYLDKNEKARQVGVNASIGHATAQHGMTPKELYNLADKRMYEEKDTHHSRSSSAR